MDMRNRYKTTPDRMAHVRDFLEKKSNFRPLMQAHIDNRRKTYASGAYFCALLSEIAVHEGRLAAFRQWYVGFMEGYKRIRAVRAERI